MKAAIALCALVLTTAPTVAQKINLEDVMKPYEAKARPDYVPPPASAQPARPGARPTIASDCRCVGCGCKGGSGWRGPRGECVSHATLAWECGSPPSRRCRHEGARQVCP